MTVRCLTRVAGKLSLRVDSRSRTIDVPADLDAADAAHPGHDRPARAPHAALTPARRRQLPGLTLRRLVLVSPLSAG